MILDTSVLSYSVGGLHPLREPCRKVLQAQIEGRIDGATTVEVLQEFTHTQARRRTRQDAAALARDCMASLRLLQTTPEDLRRGLTIFEQHPDLGVFDSMVAAVAMNVGAQALISTDHGFGSVSGLRWLDPGAPDFESQLATVALSSIDVIVSPGPASTDV